MVHYSRDSSRPQRLGKRRRRPGGNAIKEGLWRPALREQRGRRSVRGRRRRRQSGPRSRLKFNLHLVLLMLSLPHGGCSGRTSESGKTEDNPVRCVSAEFHNYFRVPPRKRALGLPRIVVPRAKHVPTPAAGP